MVVVVVVTHPPKMSRTQTPPPCDIHFGKGGGCGKLC